MSDIRRPIGLRITTSDNCEICSGSGLQIKQDYDKTFRKIDIQISVCSCVRIERMRGHNQHTISRETPLPPKEKHA